ncbi:MAG: septum site-determining protein MinD [Dorea sp.]|nr:septum site-determining protein MinD [Dorea sp.]
MGEVIVITSGKGGVGKTTTTVDVIEGTCRLKQALIRDKRYENLYLLPSAQTKDKTAISPGQMKKLTSELKEEFDYILLDCPAGIEQGFMNAIAGADRAVIVTTPEVSAIRDADRIIGLLEANHLNKMELIINRIRIDMVKHGDMMTVDDVTEILSVPLIGALPDDEQVVIGTNQGEPVIGLDSKAGTAYMNICKRIVGMEVPFMELQNNTGILTKLSNLFKKD